MTMKFLVVSDIHASSAALGWINESISSHAVDAVLILGDVTHFGPLQWALDFLRGLKAPAFVIPGNCDPLEMPDAISNVATDLHGKATDIGGVMFVGLGGSNPTIFNTPFELSEEEIMERLHAVSSPGMILMTHTPPFGTHDEIPSGISVGSVSVAEIVKRYRPRAVLSGHVHEARGITEKDGVVYMNPGPAKDGYSGLLEVGTDDVRAVLL
ncbi:MAG: metallophosphoesterase [Candidatus Methanomethylophilaceae archaeon]|jgi:Icc-related predicted phosphoesterase